MQYFFHQIPGFIQSLTLQRCAKNFVTTSANRYKMEQEWHDIWTWCERFLKKCLQHKDNIIFLELCSLSLSLTQKFIAVHFVEKSQSLSWYEKKNNRIIIIIIIVCFYFRRTAFAQYLCQTRMYILLQNTLCYAICNDNEELTKCAKCLKENL